MGGERKHYLWLAVVAALAAAVPLLTDNDFYLRVLFLIGVNYIAAAGMNVLVGYTGQKSLGHAGLFAVGAYTVALLTARWGWNPWPAFVAAGVMAGIFGIVIALPALRVKGPALAMVTIGFGIVVEKIVSEWQDVFAGQQGIYGVLPLSLGGTMFSSRHWVWFVLLLGVALHVMLRLLLRGRFGRAFMAVNTAEVAAESGGISVYRFKVLAFVIRAVMKTNTASSTMPPSSRPALRSNARVAVRSALSSHCCTVRRPGPMSCAWHSTCMPGVRSCRRRPKPACESNRRPCWWTRSASPSESSWRPPQQASRTRWREGNSTTEGLSSPGGGTEKLNQNGASARWVSRSSTCGWCSSAVRAVSAVSCASESSSTRIGRRSGASWAYRGAQACRASTDSTSMAQGSAKISRPDRACSSTPCQRLQWGCMAEVAEGFTEQGSMTDRGAVPWKYQPGFGGEY